ncbi:MAG: histidine decarboxylase [Bacteroidota bacterium]
MYTATYPKSISEKDQDRLAHLFSEIEGSTPYNIGYPVAKDFDYSELYHFLQFPINNIGDPFQPNPYAAKTHEMEREIVSFFADLFRADPQDYWGYITNGGSESNLYGLYLARENFPNSIVYFSETTHYSVKKNIRLLNVSSIVIRAQANGEMDYEDLEQALSLNRHKQAIVLANFGTTMTEAKDDISQIKYILRKLAIRDHYIHVDAALAGTYGAFMEPRVPFDFADGADSLSISGHKFIGSPIPAGVIVTRKSYKEKISKGVAYIDAQDNTIAGSRNGHSPLFLWYALKKMGREGLKARYQHSLKMTAYCKAKLQDIGIHAWSNPGAITVVLPKMAGPIKLKWHLATEEEISHVVCMPNVNHDHIDQFVADLVQYNTIDQ